MENFRLFIGISLAQVVTGRLSAIMERMAADLPFRRWTHPSDLHVTLHFLGDTPEERAESVRGAVAESAAETAPLSLALTGPGTFGPPNAPRVLWCGLSEPSEPGGLAALHAALAPRLAAAGCALEDRPFRAHVTMARQGGAGVTRDAIFAAWRAGLDAVGIPFAQAGEACLPLSANDSAAIPDTQGGASSDANPLAWTAHQITLFRSHLGRRPSYERIGEFPLTGSRSGT